MQDIKEPTEDKAAHAETGNSNAMPTEPEAQPTGDTSELENKVIESLREVYDPEIPVNIYELGLIYEINIGQDKKVDIKMTLTSPACPAAESLPVDVRSRVCHIDEVSDCEVDIVWEPQWGPDKMSEAAKLQLGML